MNKIIIFIIALLGGVLLLTSCAPTEQRTVYNEYLYVNAKCKTFLQLADTVPYESISYVDQSCLLVNGPIYLSPCTPAPTKLQADLAPARQTVEAIECDTLVGSFIAGWAWLPDENGRPFLIPALLKFTTQHEKRIVLQKKLVRVETRSQAVYIMVQVDEYKVPNVSSDTGSSEPISDPFGRGEQKNHP